VGLAFIFFQGKDMKYAVPFGPFLCLAALVYLFFGNALILLFDALRG
jgi:leader peptidase (prepilin peptidase) / N-methyltransferase